MMPPEIKKQLEAMGVKPQKLRGQHFLIDRDALAAIVEAAELKKTDTVLEIGPGLGVLTRKLLERAGHVVAVELDLAFAKHLEKTLALQGFTLIRGDVRDIDILAVVGDKKSYKLVANIPYNITSAIFEKFLFCDFAPELMVLLVQREVAERVCAAPPRMNRLAVLVQYLGQPEIVRQVPSGAFWPAPKVDSAVLRIRRHTEDVLAARKAVAPHEQFFEMVQAGFVTPRKKLFGNLLRAGYARRALERAFYKIGVDRSARAETVSMDQWFALVQAIKKP